MNAYPFTVFKRANRPYYFVFFKGANGKSLSPGNITLYWEKYLSGRSLGDIKAEDGNTTAKSVFITARQKALVFKKDPHPT